MIRLTRCTQASKAGTYFRLHLQAGDSQSQPVPPTTVRMRASWIGTGLQEVSLVAFEQPAAAHLVRLGRGLHPTERKRLAPSTNRKRAYYDLTAAAPKSVSVAALLEPTHITASSVLHAHQSAVRAVCNAVGGMIEGARRTAPAIEKWLGAVFHHTHTREGDPHLHSHIIVPNLGRNTAGDWRAVQVHIAGVRRLRLELIYGHELARCLRAHGLGHEIVMRRSGVPEIKSLLPLCKHFTRARQGVLAAAKEAETPFEPERQPPPTPEIHSRSKLPLRADQIKFKVRQRIADSLRKPKGKDADDPVKLDEESYRWRHRLTNLEARTLYKVLASADITNPQRVKHLPVPPPPVSEIVQKAFLSIKPGVPATPSVWFRALIAQSAGRHAMEDLRAGLKVRLAKRRKELARIRRQVEEDSLAMAQAHYAEVERTNQTLARGGKAVSGPEAPASASKAAAPPERTVAIPQAAESAETVAPVVPPARGRGR